MIFSLIFLFSSFQFYGLTIEIPSSVIEWSRSERKIDFLESSFQEQAQLIESHIIIANKMNDWQKIELSYRIADFLSFNSIEKRNTLIYYLWLAYNFNTILAHQEEVPVPILASDQQFFGLPFFIIRKQRYYHILQHFNPDSEIGNEAKLSLIEGDEQLQLTKDLRKLMIDFFDLPHLENDLVTRSYSWTFKNEILTVSPQINRFLRNYYHNLPVLDYPSLMNYQFSPLLRKTLIQPLQKIFQSKKFTEHEKVECLRQFILQSFPYIDDQLLFGREHIQFAEEIFLSEGCDCEDRAIFLFRLIEDLTELQPLLADYPEHVSVLVEYSQPFAGERFLYKGKSFVFCDPTYFNSAFGAIPVEIKELLPEIIERKE